jgi:hypothetical protein
VPTPDELKASQIALTNDYAKTMVAIAGGVLAASFALGVPDSLELTIFYAGCWGLLIAIVGLGALVLINTANFYTRQLQAQAETDTARKQSLLDQGEANRRTALALANVCQMLLVVLAALGGGFLILRSVIGAPGSPLPRAAAIAREAAAPLLAPGETASIIAAGRQGSATATTVRLRVAGEQIEVTVEGDAATSVVRRPLPAGSVP